jgi:Domain of unknown function (DUF4266)
MIDGTRWRIGSARFLRTADRPARMRRHLPNLLLVLMLALSGCASVEPPKPWEKDRLARPEMQFDADPLAAKQTQHIYDSKEAATGGYGVGGGGCGCN